MEPTEQEKADALAAEQAKKDGDVKAATGGSTEKKDEMVSVPAGLLAQLQEQMAAMEVKLESESAARAGLEEIINKDPELGDEKKLREKKNFEPKFRTVRLRKYPIAGDITNLGYVVGWTNRGAYQEVDRTGVSPQVVDYMDIVFLGAEKNAEGKVKAEKVKLLDLMNNGTQVHCKILDKKVEPRQEPSGEEIDVSIFDPAHGLVATGETIDGYTAFSDITYKIQVPGFADPVWIDALYCNS